MSNRKYEKLDLDKIFNNIPSRETILKNILENLNKKLQKNSSDDSSDLVESFVRFRLNYTPEIALLLPEINRFLNTEEVCEFDILASKIFGNTTYPSLCLKNSPNLSNFLVRAEFEETNN